MAIVFGQTTWQYPFNPNAPEQYLIGACALGSNAPRGGRLICKNGLGTVWIVAPACSEVSRTWYCRDDAVTTATACTSATGWFVPTLSQLQNPGYACRSFWDSFCCRGYWSSVERDSGVACGINFNNGSVGTYLKTYINCVRAFRCVTY